LHYRELIRNFTSTEIMRWPKIEEIFGVALRQTSVLSEADLGGQHRWQQFHRRVIEHNVRVIAKYYQRIRMERLAQLLDLGLEEAERTLADLVVANSVYARIDRFSGVINFIKPLTSQQALNQWSRNMDQLLSLVETIGHQINKEEMVHRISKTL